MTIETAIAHYGYAAVFLGAMLEGETVVAVAGFLAHRGYLDLASVVVAAYAAAFAGDQMFFFIGRSRGRRFREDPRWGPRVAVVEAFVRRHPLGVLFVYRFMYGVQKLTPVVIGMSGFAYRRFAATTAVTAAVWATVVAAAGFFFGNVLQALLQDVKRYEGTAVIALVAAGVAGWLIRFRLRRKRLRT